MRARCGGCIVAWASGVLAAPRTQGSWWLMQQEIQCSRRVWQPVLTNTVQYWGTLRENLPDREARQSTAYRVVKSYTRLKRPCVHRHKAFFACGSSAPVRVECEGGAAAWLVGTLRCQVCRDTDCLRCRSYGPIRVFFRASCSWHQKASLASLSL